jgi:hypothetical protein
MGATNSHHASHHHHKKISGKIGKAYEEDGSIELSDEEIKHIWDHYDTNHNGLLEEHEVEALVKDLLEHTIPDPKDRQETWETINKPEPFVPHLMKQLANSSARV